MSLFEEMKKLNNFGQRDNPPSYSLISKMDNQIDNLIYNIDLKIETNLDVIKNRLHTLLENLSKLQDQLTVEFSALWGEIEK